MIKFVLPFLLCCQIILAQQHQTNQNLTPEFISKHTTYFDIENNQFSNAEILINALDNAQFVALGELHNREKLGELTSALLFRLKKNGFKNFALETGPYSAKKLQRLIGQDKSKLKEFYSDYSSKLFNIYPIPFHTGTSDLEFLEVAHSLDYDFWGLDQEFYFGFQFLLDELKTFHKPSFSSEEEKKYKKIIRKIKRWNKRSRIFKKFDLACRLQNDTDLQTYLTIFQDSQDVNIQNIIAGIETSLHIYCLSEQGKGGNKERIAYFKENFDKIIKHSNGKTPKVFVKMGSQHLGRQKSSLGFKDIGNHLIKTADSLGKSSLHIRYMNRFYKGKDNLNNKAWKSAYNFIAAGKKNQWTLIDLRPIRQMLIDKSLSVTNYELLEIANYDFIVIPPADDWARKHY